MNGPIAGRTPVPDTKNFRAATKGVNVAVLC
jgi:hypothetical protein